MPNAGQPTKVCLSMSQLRSLELDKGLRSATHPAILRDRVGVSPPKNDGNYVKKTWPGRDRNECFALRWGALGTTRPLLMLHTITDSNEKRKEWKNELGSNVYMNVNLSVYRYTYTHIYVTHLSGANEPMHQCGSTKIRAGAPACSRCLSWMGMHSSCARRNIGSCQRNEKMQKRV